MPEFIDRINFDDLAKLDPAAVCGRTGYAYDPQEKRYTLKVWGETYEITPGEYTVTKLGPSPGRDHGLLSLFMIHYLLQENETTLDHIWISEKEIPGGATFFRGPHALPTHLITERFHNDLEAFGQRCGHLQGSPLEMADAAYHFEIVPRVPVAVLYWCGDEEFPAEAKLLFDKSIGSYLAADVVFSLAVGICERLGR